MEKTKSLENGIHSVVILQSKTKDVKTTSIKAKLESIVNSITVEPILICIILPNIMTSLTTQNLTLEKSCRVNLAFGNEICDALTKRNTSYPEYKTYEAAVQTLVANLIIWKNIILSVFPAILVLLLGSWSDRHKKRKPCFLNTILGEIVIATSMIICVYFFYELPAQVNILAESIPPAFSGGFFAMFMGLNSYISGITTDETRTVRLGTIHTVFSVCYCIGMSLSGIFYENLGFYGKNKMKINRLGLIFKNSRGVWRF